MERVPGRANTRGTQRAALVLKQLGCRVRGRFGLDGSVSASLQVWTQHATSDELRTGPRAEQIGGRAAVAAVADELADSPLFVYLVNLAGNDDAAAADESREQLDRAVLVVCQRHRLSAELSFAGSPPGSRPRNRPPAAGRSRHRHRLRTGRWRDRRYRPGGVVAPMHHPDNEGTPFAGLPD